MNLKKRPRPVSGGASKGQRGAAAGGTAPRGAVPAEPARPAKPAKKARGATQVRRRGGGAHARRPGLRIGAPGQVRIPAAGRLVALLIAAGLAAGLVMLVNGPWLRVSSVAWAGSRYVSASDVSPILDPLMGTSLLLLDESSLAARLAELPGVASASVEPRFPDGLAVQLSERTPAMLWQTSRARLIVDAGGLVFGEIPLGVAIPRELARLPVVDDRRAASRTLTTGDRIPETERVAALQLGTIDPRLAGSSATSLRVAIDDRCGYLIAPGSGGWSAALGFHGDGVSGTLDDAPTIDAQVAALRTLFATHPERSVGWVDVRNPGKVYWRPSESGSDTC